MSAHESIGLRLKREREKKSFSIEDVHLRIRIHPGVIQRLEADDLADWPGGKIYARGFLRQYAEFLGLNTPEILADFDSLGIAAKPVELFVGLERKVEPEAQEAPKPRKPRAEKKRETNVSPLERAPQPDLVRNLPPKPPVQSAPTGTHPFVKLAVALTVLIVIGLAVLQISRGVSSWYQNRPVKTSKAVFSSPAKAAARPTAAAEPTSRQAARRGTPIAPSSSNVSITPSRYLNSPQQGNYPKIRPQDRLILEVAAITDVWMRVQADGSVVFEAILHRGETERWMADKVLDIKSGRPEGVRIAMNGYPVGQPGNGKVKNLHFTRDGIEEIK